VIKLSIAALNMGQMCLYQCSTCRRHLTGAVLTGQVPIFVPSHRRRPGRPWGLSVADRAAIIAS
jgi:hypothetical protein